MVYSVEYWYLDVVVYDFEFRSFLVECVWVISVHLVNQRIPAIMNYLG